LLLPRTATAIASHHTELVPRTEDKTPSGDAGGRGNAEAPEADRDFSLLIVTVIMSLMAGAIYAYLMYREWKIAKDRDLELDPSESPDDEPEGVTEPEPIPEVEVEPEQTVEEPPADANANANADLELKEPEAVEEPGKEPEIPEAEPIKDQKEEMRSDWEDLELGFWKPESYII
jgi:hypothetical protein